MQRLAHIDTAVWGHWLAAGVPGWYVGELGCPVGEIPALCAPR